MMISGRMKKFSNRPILNRLDMIFSRGTLVSEMFELAVLLAVYPVPTKIKGRVFSARDH
jgi:hypothetical protein